MNTVLLLLLLVCIAILTTQEDPVMTQLKKRYYSFIATLPPKYKKIKTPCIITGTYYKGDIGSNVNKGGEIYVCLENSVNDAFHVLLHELSHSMVKEYDHSQSFWSSFHTLKELAQSGGFYTPVSDKPYCGKKISDDRV